MKDTAAGGIRATQGTFSSLKNHKASFYQVEERKTPDSDTFPLPQPTSKLQQFMPLPFAAFQDYSIPFPRTCGARFNSVGR